MPIGGMGASQFRGSVVQAGVYSVSVTTPTVATTVNGFVAAAVSCPGAALGDVVMVAPVAAATAGVSFTGTVTAANSVTITVHNGSGGSFTGGAGVLFTIVVLRPKTA